MFLTERELREAFWKNYNYSKRAVRYQFECDIREGRADLVTIEKFLENYQINAFEFKLSDIKKVILQAKANRKYVNRSWIVVPEEKRDVISDRYIHSIRVQGIGVITVQDSGRWSVMQQPLYQNELILNQALINLMMEERSIG